MARETAAPGEELRPEGHVESVDRDGGHPGDQEGGQDPAQAGGVPFTPSRERPRVPTRITEDIEAIMAQAGFRGPETSKDETVKIAAASGVTESLGLFMDPLDGAQMSEISQALETISTRVNILTETAASVVLVATELAEIRNQLNGKKDHDYIGTILFGTQVFQPAGAVLLCKRQELQGRIDQLSADLGSLQEAARWADEAAMLPEPQRQIEPPQASPPPPPPSDERLKRMEVEVYGIPMPPSKGAIASGEFPITGRVAKPKHWLKQLFDK